MTRVTILIQPAQTLYPILFPGQHDHILGQRRHGEEAGRPVDHHEEGEGQREGGPRALGGN